MPEKILIVDDEEGLSFLYKRKFKKQIEAGDYELLFAENGKQALDALQAHDDLCIVLTDINMPEMDGFELLKTIQEWDRLVTVVVVSAYGDIESVRRTMRLGAFDFIVKPINFSEVDLTIAKARKHLDLVRESKYEASRASAALKASEEAYKTLVDGSPDAILVHADQQILFCNPAGLNLLGADSLSEIKGKSFFDFFGNEDRWELVADARKLERNISVQPQEVNLIRLDGSEVLVSITGSSHLFEGKPAILQNIRDLSESVRIEKRLQKLSKKAEIFLQSSIDGFAVVDAEGRIQEVNCALEDLLGYKEEELIGKKVTDLDENPEKMVEFINHLFLEGQGSYESVANTGHRGKRDFNIRAKHFQEDGKSMLVGFVQDVTERKQAEKAIREQTDFLETLINTLPAPMYHKGRDGHYIMCNDAYARFVGKSKDEIIGHTIRDLSQPDMAKVSEERDNDLFETGAEQSFESKVYYAKKEPREVFFHKAPFRNSDGEITGLVGTIIDITDRKKAEAENALLATAIHQSAESVVITDPDANIQYVNPAFEKVTGYSAEEAINARPSIMASGVQAPEFYEKMWSTLKNKEVWHGRLVNQKKDNSLMEVEMTITPVLSDENEIINFVSVQRDVTYETKLEKHIRESHKLEAIGTLAGGIAHDFNNLLFAMLLSIKMVKDDMQEGDENLEMLNQAYQAAQRAKELVKQILIFSHQEEQEFHQLEIISLIKESVRLLRSTLPQTIEVELNLPDSIGAFSGDPAQIQQLFMNLGANASDAMKESGGTFSVSLFSEQLEPRKAHSLSVEPGAYLKIVVQDTGPGISEDIRERLFEPFFTTKAVGEGTGLGLSVVHGIVKRHEGTIVLDRNFEEGARFEIYLPVKHTTELQPFLEEKPVEKKACEGRLLMVDDEEMVVKLQKKILERAGFTVKEFTGSREALAYFSEHLDDFDLVLTDQTMPSMTGEQLARAVKQLREDIPVVIATGYSAVMDAEKAEEQGIDAFLMKPVSDEDLIATTSRLIEECQKKMN